jgi:hypothetical protein
MLDKINEIYKSVRRLTGQYLGKKALKDRELKKSIADLNREQLLSGRGADGEYLPRYVDDPYFKSVESATRYEQWKATISIGEKPTGVMDFYIDGTFHRTIKFVKDDEGFTTKSDSSIISSVQSKTNNQALGINETSIEQIIPEVTEYLQSILLTEIQKNI